MQAALVTFDHLALAFLGCYGTTRVLTPHFDRFAAGSVVFDQCYGVADADAARGGLAELTRHVQFAGGRAVVHRCNGAAATDAGLREAMDGWRQTAGATPSLLWLQSPGIESPWTAAPDRIAAAWRSAFPNDALPEALRECGVGTVGFDAPEAMIAAVWPQIIDQGVLARDNVAASIALGRLRSCVYAAAVSVLDHWLGEVLALLTAAAGPESLLIVAAGAGDLTAPHVELAAGCPPLLAPLVHVPLLIRTPTTQDGTRRNALVSYADLAPTLAEWFQLGAPAGEYSLWPLLQGESHSVRKELLIGSEDLGWSLRTPEYACLATSRDLEHEFPEQAWLFVKPDDAWETLNVARQLPDITAEYCRRMRAAASGGV